MAKRKRKVETIHVLSSYEATLASREHFNPFQTGHGLHKNAKHPNRSSQKAAFRKEIRNY